MEVLGWCIFLLKVQYWCTHGECVHLAQKTKLCACIFYAGLYPTAFATKMRNSRWDLWRSVYVSDENGWKGWIENLLPQVLLSYKSWNSCRTKTLMMWSTPKKKPRRSRKSFRHYSGTGLSLSVMEMILNIYCEQKYRIHIKYSFFKRLFPSIEWKCV